MDGLLDRLFPANPVLGLLGDESMQQQARQQGLLGLAAGLLQAGGPSRTRTNIGQALGSGLMAGQQMYQNAVNQQISQAGAMQKMQEAQRLRQQQELVRQVMPQLVTTERQQALTTGAQAADPLAALIQSAEAGTLNQPAINQAALNTLRGALDPDQFKKVLEAIKIQTEVQQPKRDIREVGGALVDISSGRPQTIMPAAPKLQQVGDSLYEVVPGQSPKLVVSGQGKFTGEFANVAKGLYGTDVVSELPSGAFDRINAEILRAKEAGRTVIDITGGQKGFENETKLRTEFQGSPEYKAFGEMKAAYGQVLEGLKKANAIGDLAAATKIMKLLDPGSVVRESELALAMQAGGLLDRVANYATNIKEGTKLSPAQRKEFAALSDALFSVSLNAFNEKRGQYSNLAEEYGFDTKRVIGSEPNIPGLQKPAETGLSLQEQAKRILDERRKRGQ